MQLKEAYIEKNIPFTMDACEESRISTSFDWNVSEVKLCTQRCVQFLLFDGSIRNPHHRYLG